jgi:hypothetical protein
MKHRLVSLVVASTTAMIAIVAPEAPAKSTFTSSYVSIKQSDCRKQPQSKNRSFVSFRCGTAAGWQIWLEYEEGMTFVSLRRGRIVNNTGIDPYTSGDTTTGDRLELRLRNGTLSSTVVRLNTYSGETVTKSVLAVSSMGSGGCLVALVEPGPDQSAQARSIADKAATLPCKE